jgi:hypothetical protein
MPGADPVLTDPGVDARTLEQYLVESRIAGPVATPRESNLSHARRLAAGEPAFEFGLPTREPWSYERIVALLADRVGIDPDLSRTTGPDTIDPARTREGLDRLRERLHRAIAGRQRILLATGHPTGILEIHLGLADGLRRAGCPVLTPGAGARYRTPEHYGDVPQQVQVRYIGSVATCGTSFALWHSHAAEGMHAILAALTAAGDPPPDLVIADHGFAGAAAQAGLSVVGFADSNDPSLFIGEAEGRIEITVPLDDNVQPHLYRPIVDYLLRA